MPGTGLLEEVLRRALDGTDNHTGLEKAVSGFSWESSGDEVGGFPRSIFALLWHMDARMRDIIARVEEESYRKSQYPGGFWPAHGRPVAESEWRITLEQARRSLSRIRGWIETRDLKEPLRHRPDTTVVGQIMTAAVHNSYHIGQIVILRSLLGVPVDTGNTGTCGPPVRS
jgi:uncharacterized damage-inducible protein DinB